MEKKYVSVKLTWNTGYSKIVRMSKGTYEYYTKERHWLTHVHQGVCIDWASDDGKVAVCFQGLICMEIVEEQGQAEGGE